jgi:uncharacterized protein (TIGR02646 family)
MRPVDRGIHPRDQDDQPVMFGEYSQAAPYLKDRLGRYCSFCERKLPVSLAVEHVLPKSRHPDKRLDWHNFLLACANCNSTKGDQDIDLSDYFWPDRDNTFRAFRYFKGLITTNPDLIPESQECAKRTLGVFGLDKNTCTSRDHRWLDRQEAWAIAERSLTLLKRQDTPDFRDYIVQNARAHGHWSCWFTVFAEDEDMLRRLSMAFPGTDSPCFDDRMKPLLRPGGRI